MRTAALALCIWVCSSALGAPAPRLDGFVNDSFWFEKARSWTLYDPARTDTVTRCFLGYDDQYLYFGADVSDTNVVGSNNTVKSKAWEDDAVKLLVHTGDPQATSWTAQTVSYTFSASGGITWARGPLAPQANPSLESTWPPAWDSGLNWASSLKPGTTPNVAGTPDTGYAVEARIPWTELQTRPPFQPGSAISFCVVNLCRPEMGLPEGQPVSLTTAARQVTPANPSVWIRLPMDWYGSLPTRGLVKPLPLWLGSLSPEYAVYKGHESDPQGLWWNRDGWKARFDRMRSQNANTLVLRHTNPWTGLLAPATAQTRPAADARDTLVLHGWFANGEFERSREQFRWVLAQAAEAGIRVTLMFDDDQTASPGVPSTQPATATAPAWDDVSAKMIAEYVAGLCETYPDLAGVILGPGFNTSPVLAAAADALADTTRRRSATSTPVGSAPAGGPNGAQGPHELWIWTDGLDPQVAAATLDRYPHTRLTHALQGPQWHKPLADAGLQEFVARVEQSRKVKDAPVQSMVLGSMRGALEYVFWSDPQWARALMLDVRNQGHQGFLLDPGRGEHDVGREALFEYAYNAGQQFNAQRWESRLQLYGVGEYAGQLLEAMQHASAIMPEVLLLLNDASPRYMPQFGLLLTHYQNLPAYSDHLPKDRPADTRARLLTNLGPAWPDPVWGKPVASIRADTDRSAPPDAVVPWDIAANISRHVDAVKSLLTGLRHVKASSPEQAAALNSLLDSIEFNILLGDHFAQKIKAAVAFEQFKSRRGRAVDCLQPLQKSVEAWAQLAEIGDRLYPEPVQYWQSQIVSPPPWTPGLIETSYVSVTGAWRDQVPRFQRELNLLRDETNKAAQASTPPLWDHVNAASDDSRQTRFVFDFEHADARLSILPGASVSETPGQTILGRKSLLVDTRQMPAGRHEVFATDAAHVPLMSAQKYQIAMLYRIVDPGRGPVVFEMGVRPAVGGAPIGDHRTWTAPAGHTGSRILQVPGPAQDGNVFYIATNAPSAILVDGIIISQIVK